MSSLRKQKASTLTVIGFAVLLATVRALGEGNQDGYSAPIRKDSTPWLAITVGLVMLVGACIVALRDAKRTHLD